MKSAIAWIAVAVLIVVLLVGLPILFRFTGLGWYGGMWDGRGMMGGHYGYFFPLGFLWMGLMMLAPVAVLVLLVIGGVALANNLTRTNPPTSQPAAASSRTCGNCGKPAQADWNNCPYCGNALS
jgi:uncharacterized membrane protein